MNETMHWVDRYAYTMTKYLETHFGGSESKGVRQRIALHTGLSASKISNIITLGGYGTSNKTLQSLETAVDKIVDEL